MAAFQAALDMGVTTLELDVGMTRDGVVVAHHDRRLNPERTRGPDGSWIKPAGEPPAITTLTFEALGAFDIGRPRPGSRTLKRFPEQETVDGQRIPALSDVIAAAEARSGATVRYNVETKISPLAPEETASPEAFADALVRQLRKSGITDRSTVQSFDWRTLQRVQAVAPEIATAYLSAEQRWLDNVERGKAGPSPWSAGFDPGDHDDSLPRTIVAAGGRIWSPYFRDLSPAALEEAQRLGLRVLVWTVNEADDMANLVAAGVDGIITDYPDRLRRVLEGKGYSFDPVSRLYRVPKDLGR